MNNLPGQEILVFESTWQPGFRLPLHIHPPPNTPHFGRNATNKVSKTVVIRVKDKDKPIMVEIKK